MSYGFARAISACEVDGQVVCLDRQANRYFALGAVASRTVIALSQGRGVTDQLAVSRLVARGVLAEGQKPATLFDWPSAGSSALERDAETKGRAADIVRIASSLLKVQVRQRRWAFDPTLSLMAAERSRRAARAGSSHDHLAKALDRSGRFTAARRWAPGKPNCLTDSLALLDFLGPVGRDARLVFGVNMTPWAAHCWVQIDDWVLNDATHRVAAFSPIMAV
ncbi:MAG TPA: lasso peptide biosynthesis B2 protein [Caulobacter sp.]|nr:lasso peptide biosynthesis B2 protein [Caulobacter sp.]